MGHIYEYDNVDTPGQEGSFEGVLDNATCYDERMEELCEEPMFVFSLMTHCRRRDW